MPRHWNEWKRSTLSSLIRRVPSEGFNETDLLRLAASLERASEHPLASAVVAAAVDRGLTLSDPCEFDSSTGKGVIGIVEGRRLMLGTARFLLEQGVDTTSIASTA